MSGDCETSLRSENGICALILLPCKCTINDKVQDCRICNIPLWRSETIYFAHKKQDVVRIAGENYSKRV